jgi:hypothetical protein
MTLFLSSLQLPDDIDRFIYLLDSILEFSSSIQHFIDLSHEFAARGSQLLFSSSGFRPKTLHFFLALLNLR